MSSVGASPPLAPGSAATSTPVAVAQVAGSSLAFDVGDVITGVAKGRNGQGQLVVVTRRGDVLVTTPLLPPAGATVTLQVRAVEANFLNVVVLVDPRPLPKSAGQPVGHASSLSQKAVSAHSLSPFVTTTHSLFSGTIIAPATGGVSGGVLGPLPDILTRGFVAGGQNSATQNLTPSPGAGGYSGHHASNAPVSTYPVPAGRNPASGNPAGQIAPRGNLTNSHPISPALTGHSPAGDVPAPPVAKKNASQQTPQGVFSRTGPPATPPSSTQHETVSRLSSGQGVPRVGSPDTVSGSGTSSQTTRSALLVPESTASNRSRGGISGGASIERGGQSSTGSASSFSGERGAQSSTISASPSSRPASPVPANSENSRSGNPVSGNGVLRDGLVQKPISGNPISDRLVSGGSVSGGSVSGGSVSGGPVSGGSVSGGPVSGGSVSGGPVSGGPVSGGPVSGGPVSGGLVSGGSVSGGPVSGGSVSGGSVSGGPVSGGSVSGGSASGGPVSGGSASGSPVSGGPQISANSVKTPHTGIDPAKTFLPGVRLEFRLVALENRPVGSSPITLLHDTAGSFRTESTLIAGVVSKEVSGIPQTQTGAPTRILTSIGTIGVDGLTSLPARASVVLQLIQAFPPDDVAERLPASLSFEEISRGQWPGLEDAVSTLLSGHGTQIPDRVLPAPGPRLAGLMLLFITALRGGDATGWLGEDGQNILAQTKPVLQRLRDDFSRFGQFLTETQPDDWRFFVLPVYDGRDHHLMHWRVRRHREQANQEDQESQHTRFVVDLKLSQLGDMQFDGFLKERQFDLVIRTRQTLLQTMQRDIRNLYLNAQQIAGFHGEILFQVREQFIQPMRDEKQTSGGASHSSLQV